MLEVIGVFQVRGNGGLNESGRSGYQENCVEVQYILEPDLISLVGSGIGAIRRSDER